MNAYKAVLAAQATFGTNINTPPDTTAPNVAIIAPASGSIVSGVVSIQITAEDDIGAVKVECYMNGQLAASSSTAPAIFSWDTAAYANGSYTLEARAYDAAGNIGTSAPLSVSVENPVPDLTPPTVRITSPISGAVVAAKTTKVYVAASDNVAVTRVDLLVDGKSYSSSSSATPVFIWSTGKLSRGSHTLQAVACDAAGNSTRSAVVSVTKS